MRPVCRCEVVAPAAELRAGGFRDAALDLDPAVIGKEARQVERRLRVQAVIQH